MNEKSSDVILRNSRPCMREFYDAVRFQVADVLAELLPTRKYTLRQLAGEAFCKQLSPGLRQQAGRCLAHLVESGGIRLVFASTEGKWPRRYQLASIESARRTPRPDVGPLPDSNT